MKPIAHGTERGYQRGCKCDPCKAAHSRYVSELRSRSRSSDGTATYKPRRRIVGSVVWQESAACQTVPAGDRDRIFFPEYENATAEAKAFCDVCPVRRQCLDYAIENHIDDGIWGGRSRRQRIALRRAARSAPTQSAAQEAAS